MKFEIIRLYEVNGLPNNEIGMQYVLTLTVFTIFKNKNKI
jgi:hypothetical protein